MTEPTSLRNLDRIDTFYTVPGGRLVEDVLIPAMTRSIGVECMAGFFSSTAFKHVALGLAAFVNESSGVLRLLISPTLSEEDKNALHEAVEQPALVLSRAAESLIRESMLSPSALEQHAITGLAYLAAASRLEIRFVLMSTGGMFHPKVWIFSDAANDTIVVHGSSNPTSAGLAFNFEVVSIEKAWVSSDTHARAHRFSELFETLWSGRDPDTITIGLPSGLALATIAPSDPPTIEDFWRAWKADAASGLFPPLPHGHNSQALDVTALEPTTLRIPENVTWDHGPFKHQGTAVAAWESAGGRGLLAMATGSGKTITALVCAARLFQKRQPLFVVIAAPYRPLVEQWREAVRYFSTGALLPPANSSTKRDAAIRLALRRLERSVSQVEILVTTHDHLLSDNFRTIMEQVPSGMSTLLIADEVHNLGRPRFVQRPPLNFEYRLGLSATPVLQYNELGTKAITNFFGPTVFEFTLAEAIGVCLVPYNYYLHPVALGLEELDQWEDLTAKLIRVGFATQDNGGADGSLSPEVLALLVRRRAVLEGAEAKVSALMGLLKGQGLDTLRHTLIYCTDKRPTQLQEVNRALITAGVYVRQLTAEETLDTAKTAQILDDFALGNYQVLTCKRVLDEGVNIPQVKQAFLLASSTVRRQWIQRRGRILRRCDLIGKTIAHLHDFLVVPPNHRTPAGKAILRQELERARAFAELSSNAGSHDGAFATMSTYLDAD